MNKRNKEEGFSFDDLKDNIKFGEQAYEPPTIKVVPKKRKLNVSLTYINSIYIIFYTNTNNDNYDNN